MTVEIIALVEKDFGQKILEEMNSSPGVLQILNATGRSDDLFDNKQFGTFGEAAIVTIIADSSYVIDKVPSKNLNNFLNSFNVRKVSTSLLTYIILLYHVFCKLVNRKNTKY